MRYSILLQIFIAFTIYAQAQTSVTSSTGTNQAIPPDFFGYNGQNVINGAQNWSTLSTHLSILQPGTLRYPGGTLGNWWDWHKGWFITDSAARVHFTYGTPKSYLGDSYQPLDSMASL